ncbi:MAG TPA: hypothetical protein VFX70_13570 [Mycobacteriales bacterium]|nr:hypothetical protein [Mycobacteriales bacterium]
MGGTRLPDRLISPVERWGWEYRDPRTVVPAFAEEPPAPDVVAPDWSARYAELVGQAERGRRGNARTTVALAVMAVGVGLPFGPLAALLPALAAAGFGWRALVHPARLRRRAHRAYQGWLAGSILRHVELRGRVAVWWQRRGAYQRWAADRADSAPEWFPVRPATVERADVCGGSAQGWRHLLAATAGSLLGSGARVTVLDLSGDRVTGPLRAVAAAGGYPCGLLTLPEQMCSVNPLRGLTAEQVAVVVAEAVHAVDRESAHEARSVDATVLQQVCEQLDPPVSFSRLHAALRVLLRQEPPPSGVDSELDSEVDSGVGPAADSVLTGAEYGRLDALFGEAARRGAEERVFRLAAALARLAALGGDTSAAGLFDDPNAPLRVVEVSENAVDLTGELLVQLLFQVAAHDLRRAEPDSDRPRVLVVAGADALPRAGVERLDQLARRRGVRTVLMFRHLREDAVDLLGGGEAAVFMRVGNAREAEQAATFIGREHRLVAGQFTVSRGDSSSESTSDSTSRGTSTQESTSAGEQWSRSRGVDFGLLLSSPGRSGSRGTGGQSSTTTGSGTSWTEGRTTSTQSGVSTGESVGYQRTYDYTVTPKFLQDMSSTAFVLVDPRDPGSPRLGDCDPAILDEPRVAEPSRAAQRTDRPSPDPEAT